jgi:hypothetical protein
LNELAEIARNGLEAAGCRGAAQKALEALLSSPDLARLHPTLVAAQFLQLQEREKALEWLERAWQARAVRMLDLGAEPAFDVVRSDTRFQTLFRKMKPPE